ncbi:MAG: sulfatase-like hydrolase/transferase [Planctomycetaceae bacterium]
MSAEIVLPRTVDRQLSAVPSPRNGAHVRLIDALHVFVLTGFAVAQPLYDRLAERPAVLVDMGVSRLTVVLFVLALSFALPCLIVLAETAACCVSRRMYEAVHSVVIFMLSVLMALPVVKMAGLSWSVLEVLAALAVAGAATWAYFQKRFLRTIVSAAIPGIVIFPAVFLSNSGLRGAFLAPQRVQVERGSPVPVVILVFDEFSGVSLMNEKREIDAERFPNFAELARRSTWYRNSTTVHADTWEALPAILSGNRTQVTSTPLPADIPQNLFSVLESTGAYERAIFEPVSRLAPFQREGRELPAPGAFGLADALARVLLFHIAPLEFHRRLPPLPNLWFGVSISQEIDTELHRGVFRYCWGDRRDRQFEHFLECLDGGPTPTLYFQHLMLPHVPWCYLPSGQTYAADGDQWDLLNFTQHNQLLHHWGSDEWVVVQSHQRYLLQLRYVDLLIGRLLARLDECGLFDRGLLIVTADHGVSFRARQPRRTAADATRADIMSVPLFIKLPFQTAGAISDWNVEAVDILPTIADVLRIKLPDPVEGQSVIDASLPERPTKHWGAHRSEQTFNKSIAESSDGHLLQFERFGSGNPQALFNVGPRPELIGQRVSKLSVATSPAVEIDITRFGDTRLDDPQSMVPCLIEGDVRVPHVEREPVVLAIAVNGVIEAVTRTCELDGLRQHFSALFPEIALRTGHNDVRIYAVNLNSTPPRLTECILQQAPVSDELFPDWAAEIGRHSASSDGQKPAAGDVLRGGSARSEAGAEAGGAR